MKNRIYLDYNASTPMLPQAWEAMTHVLAPQNGAHALNASSIHHFGRVGRKIIEDARRDIATLTGADTNQVIFNSGATEANNTVIHYFAANFPHDTILVSAIEHPSVLEAALRYKNTKVIPVNANGQINQNALQLLLEENKVCLVSCMYANNETGAIQDVSNLSFLSHKNGAYYHCDATQAIGRIPVNIKESGIDFLTLSSHKIGGAQGTGALVLGSCGQTPALLFGGGQEKSARAGTENLAGIASFGASAKHALNTLDSYAKIETLRDKLERGIKAISPDIIIHCENVLRLANTCFFSLPNADAQSLLIAFDLDGIAISNGSACSSGTVKPSSTLQAMGLDRSITTSALRISMGWATKKDEIDMFLQAWTKIYERIQTKP